MAIGTPVELGTSSSIASGTTTSITLGTTVSVGDLIILFFGGYGVTTGTVTAADNATGSTNAYQSAIDRTNNAVAPANNRAVILICPVTTALIAGNVLTITHDSIPTRSMTAWKVSGLATSSTKDQSNSGVANASVTANCDSGNITTTQADELLVGLTYTRGSNSAWTTGTITPVSPWTGGTQVSTTQGSGLGSNTKLKPQYRIVSSIGTYKSEATLNTAAPEWTELIVSLKGLVAGGGASSSDDWWQMF